MDFQDWNVYEEITKSGLGIFQWESETAHRYYKRLFSKETLSNIKNINPNLNYLDLLSIGNGSIRPAGESYREDLAKGLFYDNGHESLNKFLTPTLGRLVFQEQILQFLNKFCGYSMLEADIVRRGFAKKTGTEQFIPKIKDGFIQTMISEYGLPKEDAENIIEQFLIVIQDASSYLFSSNHSNPYSMIGFACAYLRHYHTIEFMTVYMNINKSDQDKISNAMKYINDFTDIKVVSPKFRFAKSDCVCNNDGREIYKGMSAIKGVNESVANGLYELRNNNYNYFTDLLNDIFESSIANKAQLDTLIKLDYFQEFGLSKVLCKIVEVYNKYYSCKVLSKKNLNPKLEDIVKKYARATESQYRDIDNQGLVSELISLIPNKDFSLVEKIKFQFEFLGYSDYKNENIDPDYHLVIGIERKYKNPTVDLYNISTGSTKKIKCKAKDFDKNEFVVWDMLSVVSQKEEGRWKQIDGEWVQDRNNKEPILKEWRIIKC
jgi:DNA polymerase-3 subunit alpha